jgi:hypothetical protein
MKREKLLDLIIAADCANSGQNADAELCRSIWAKLDTERLEIAWKRMKTQKIRHTVKRTLPDLVVVVRRVVNSCWASMWQVVVMVIGRRRRK